MRSMLTLAVLLPSLAMSAPVADRPTVERTISVSGEAEVRVVPDTVQLSVGVVAYDKVLGKAKALNDDRVKKTMAALTAQGLEAKNVQTDHLSVEPRRENSSYGRGYSDTPDGYEVRRTLVVTLKDLKKFEAVVSAVLEAGAHELSGLSFLTSELRKHRDTARALALKAAKEKAAAMASELGLKATKARSISEGSSGWAYWSPSGRGGGMSQNVMQNLGGGSEPSGEGFAPGLISVKASVNVVFELE